MATITTTTQNPVLAYPAQSYIDRAADGALWAMVSKGSGSFELWRSASGVSWSLVNTLVRANVQAMSSIYINGESLFWAYRVNESNRDVIYSRSSLITATSVTWDAECEVIAGPNGGVAGAVLTGIDLAVVAAPWGTTYIAVAGGWNAFGNHGVYLGGVTMDQTTRVSTHNDAIFTGTNFWVPDAGSAVVTPSIGIEHNGDGKSSSTPHLWVSFGRTVMHTVKLGWNIGSWAGPASATNDLAVSAQNSVTGRWDGTRWIRTVPNPSSTSTVRLLEYNQAQTILTLRTSPTHPTGVVRNTAVAINYRTGDVRVFAVGTSTAVLYYVDYVRATNSWGAWTIAVATAILGGSADNYNVRRDTYGNARVDVLTAHSGAPNTVVHTGQILPFAPNTPVWNTTGLPYTNGTAADVASALTLDWDFSDVDPADTQSAYALSRQIGAGALAYFRASDSTWQATEQKNLTATTSRVLSAGWGLDADGHHVYKIRYWDSTDVASGYSDPLTIIPSAVVNPAITAPAAAAVLTTSSVTMTWTAAQQTAYRVILQTNPGGVVFHDSGWITGTALSYTPPVTLPDLTGWTITLQTKNTEGLASAVQSRNFTVDYVEPATPTLVATAVPASGWISVVITNPAPSGGQPALASQELYRRVVGTTGDGTRLATSLASGATYLDRTAVSRTPYQYRVRALGVNGTSIYGAWTT